MKQKIKIGRTDLHALPFVLGGNVFGWTADQKTSFDILDKFLSEGFQMIDTANCYSYWAEGNEGGESETVIGNWLKTRGNRKDILVATKVGSTYIRKQGNLNPNYMRQEIETSLRRLQTDYIDIYYTHHDDLTTPLEEVLATYAQFVKEGKVRYIATSNMTAERIRQSIDISRKEGYPEYMIMQPEYNMHKREKYETLLQPTMQEMDLAVFPYFPLASGFLTGKYKNIDEAKSMDNPRRRYLEPYLDDRGAQILKALHLVAEEYKATPAQIALAWLMANKTITAPLSSVSKVSQLDILKCIDITLSTESIDILNEASGY